MAIKSYKPTTPSRRQMTVTDYSVLSKVEPEKSLLEPLKKNSGRNSYGRITVRHRGGGNRRKYRVIDFKRDKDGVIATVLTLEYDPNRSAFIALVQYEDGEKRYILAPNGLKVGDKIESGSEADIKPGNALKLKDIPVGTFIHAIELYPGKGAQLVRSAGNQAQLMGKEETYALVRLPSGEMRKVPINAKAAIGQVSNIDHENVNYGKAGRVRLSYSFRADYLPDELFLAVESPDDFEIEINANKGAFEKTDKKWVDPCFSVLRISKKAFKAGRNEITLSCDFKNSLNLEAVYLLGDFAVGLDEGGAVLKELPERILPGDITAQGFPFYGAGITYFADLPVSGEGRRVLQTDGYGAALIVVSDGCEEKGIWARPYRADITGMGTAGGRFGLKYVLTRTNTFGIKCAAGGQNGSFYHPLPQGMTAGVRLCRYE